MKRPLAENARGYAQNNGHIGGVRSPSTHHRSLRASTMDRLTIHEVQIIPKAD